jgi:hypothetical protein
MILFGIFQSRRKHTRRTRRARFKISFDALLGGTVYFKKNEIRGLNNQHFFLFTRILFRKHSS